MLYILQASNKCITCIHNYSTIQDSFTALFKPSVLHLFLPPHCPAFHSLAISNLFIASSVFPSSEYHIVAITMYITLSDWFLSLSNSIWNSCIFFFHVVISHCTFSKNNLLLYRCTTVCQIIYLFKNILVDSEFWHKFQVYE